MESTRTKHVIPIDVQQNTPPLMYLRTSMAEANGNGMKIDVAMNVNGDSIIVDVDDKQTKERSQFVILTRSIVEAIAGERERQREAVANAAKDKK